MAEVTSARQTTMAEENTAADMLAIVDEAPGMGGGGAKDVHTAAEGGRDCNAAPQTHF
jgi:hypothetical protein